MQNNDNLSEPTIMAKPYVARLFSEAHLQSLTITVLDYEFPHVKDGEDSNWYRTIIEYQDSEVHLQWKTCDFNAESFRWCAQSLKLFRGYEPEPRSLLTLPYGDSFSIEIFSKTPTLMRSKQRGSKRVPLRRFKKSQSGIFVKGKIRDFPFQFKTNRLEIKKFNDSIAKIAATFPSRYLKKYDLNPLKTLEARFSGVAVSDDAVKWCSKWIEDDIKCLAAPLLRVIARRERRSVGKPRALTVADRTKLIEYANQIARKKVIDLWRCGHLGP